MRSTEVRSAPRAMRTPISLLLCDTMYDNVEQERFTFCEEIEQFRP